jgi:hypothetical protein
MTTLFMQALRSGWFRVGALVLSAMAIGLPIAASASSSTASESKNTAAFRKEFVSYLTQMQQVGAMLQSSPRGRAALTRLGVKPSTLVRSREAVQHMTPSELAVLQKAFAAVPGWQTHPRDLKAALRRNGFSPNGPVRAFAVGPDCDPGPGSPLGITDWYIAVGVALALEIAHEAIPDDIITSIAQVAAAGLWGIAATAALALESVNGVENECNDAKLEDFTRTQLDVAVSTRATQTSVDAFVANFNNLSTLVNSRLDVAVSTRATQASLNAFHNEFTTNATTVNTKLDGITSSVASANSKLDSLAITVGDQGALALRLQIEADLSEPGNHPVALFEVPASGGGYLDLTREIVVDTIAKMQAAGQGVGNAQAHLAAGDAARAAQDYKNAYADYGKAYRAAAT